MTYFIVERHQCGLTAKTALKSIFLFLKTLEIIDSLGCNSGFLASPLRRLRGYLEGPHPLSNPVQRACRLASNYSIPVLFRVHSFEGEQCIINSYNLFNSITELSFPAKLLSLCRYPSSDKIFFSETHGTSVCATRIQPGLTGISGKSNYRQSNLLFEPLLHKHRISPP